MKKERVVWNIGKDPVTKKKRPNLKLLWTRGSALALSKEGFDQPDGNRFWAFVVTFLWACCQNRGAAGPEQFAEHLPEDEQEVMQVFCKLLRQTQWAPLADVLEKNMSGEAEDDDVVIGGDSSGAEPGKSDTE